MTRWVTPRPSGGGARWAARSPSWPTARCPIANIAMAANAAPVRVVRFCASMFLVLSLKGRALYAGVGWIGREARASRRGGHRRASSPAKRLGSSADDPVASRVLQAGLGVVEFGLEAAEDLVADDAVVAELEDHAL